MSQPIKKSPFTKLTVSVVAVGAAATGLGIGASSLASAQETTPAPQTSSPAGGNHTGDDKGPRGHREPGGVDAEALAGKLGVDRAKVSEALQAIGQEHRADKPADGAAPDAGRPDPAGRTAELAKSMAEKLGLKQAKVKTALDELGAEHRAAEATELKTRLDQAVTDGKLTRAEADAVLKAEQAGVIDAHGHR